MNDNTADDQRPETKELAVAAAATAAPAPLAPPTKMAGALLPNAQKLQLFEQIAEYIIKSGEFERRFRGRGEPKAKAMMMLIKADSLEISINDALEHVYVIDGKTGLSGQLMLRLINERAPNRTFTILERSEKIARIKLGRPGEPADEFEFTIERAEKAGLLHYYKDGERKESHSWKAYREEMLLWRAVAKGARVKFPEVLQGCYLLDELTSGPDLNDPNAADWAVQQVADETRPPAAEPKTEKKQDPKKEDPARQEIRNLIYMATGLTLEAQGYVPGEGDWDDRFKDASRKLSEELCQTILGHVPDGEPDVTPDQLDRMRMWLKGRKRSALLNHVCRLALIARGTDPASPSWNTEILSLIGSTWDGMCKDLIGSPVAPEFEFSEEIIDKQIDTLAQTQKHLKTGGKL